MRSSIHTQIEPLMNHPNNQYTTLFGAVEDLKKQGYTDVFILNEEGLNAHELPLDPEKFTIDSFHRFEGPSDPADMSIVYAISSEEFDLKGLLIGAYGANAQDLIQRMVKKLPAHEHKGRVQPVQPIEQGENVKV